MSEKKKMKCLMCDRLFNTTPDTRICSPCKHASYVTVSAGMDYRKYSGANAPVNTRNTEGIR